jgi:2-polyprenyl-6-methoxyphenol hydroxylase-like FAD-dependent oxidoreductase
MNQTQAVVLGGSIAGLLAARILSDVFEQVIVLDRDCLPTTPTARRGVPQSVQPHVLFTQGYRILNDLFPQIGDDLHAAGAVPIDWGQEFFYFSQGDWNATTDTASDLVSVTCTRPLLEACLRQRVQHLANVELREHCRVIGLDGDRASHHISGVYVTSSAQSTPQRLSASLVVDASGRGTQVPNCLQALGLTPPPMTRVDARLGYATRRYRIPDAAAVPWKVLLISQQPPDNPRLGYLAQVEQDEWIATLGGYEADYPPLDDAGFLDFAQSLAHPAFYQAICNAEPVSPIRAHRATANQRYRYEQIDMPTGLIALGDAVCALCPVYGQGMTVSALSAKVLQHWLHQINPNDLHLKTAEFQQRLACCHAFPWSVAVGQDTQFPSVQTQAPANPPLSRWFQAYLRKLLRLAHQDAALHVRFMALAHMVASPLSLLSPPVLWKALVRP